VEGIASDFHLWETHCIACDYRVAAVAHFPSVMAAIGDLDFALPPDGGRAAASGDHQSVRVALKSLVVATCQ